ncbi:MAG: bifunctional oligoribonuclease/PAP phosphatase NrnA [Clostridia bacterium]|nr:bifunctional oligoribonuclease/PAP phosphatase NrnA [Clostridia bacterium]
MTETAENSTCRLLDVGQCAEWLQTYNNYLILCHAHPDGDTLGAGMGLRNLLRLMGKTAHLICASPIPYRLSFLTEERDSVLLEQLPDGFFWDRVISVDIASPSLMGAYALPFGEEGRVDLAIDHHGTNTLFAKEACIDGSLAACAELVFDIGAHIFGWNDTDRIMPQDIAVPLYSGLNTDSGSFKYGAVTPATHHRAAAMLASGIEHAKIAERLYGSRPISSVMAAKAAYEDLRFFSGNRISLVTFTEETMKKYGLRDDDIDDIVNLIRGIQGVRIAVHIKPRGEGVFKLSLRCEQGLNVVAVCAKFGGGGHPCAAGCTIEGSPREVEAAVLAALEDALRAAEGEDAV